MTDLPEEIKVWRTRETLDHVGAWATTRYPEEAVAYVPKSALAEARAAQAGVVERAASTGCRICAETRHVTLGKQVEDALRALADPTGVALLAELRDRAEKAEAGKDKWMNRCMEEVGQHLETKAERDRLAAANAVLEAKETDLMNFVRWACDAPSLHQVQQRAHELLGKKDD